MKLQKTTGTLITIILMYSFYPIYSQGLTRSSGIGLRGSFWKVSGKNVNSTYSFDDPLIDVSVGDMGGSIYFFSRVHNNLFMEISAGGVGDVHTEQRLDNITESVVNVFSITPILLGLRYDFLSPQITSKFQPYLNAGTGPYILSDIETKTSHLGRTNRVESTMKGGFYAGIGTHVTLKSWLALNFEGRYHFVDYNFNGLYSGMEFGVGLCFLWGKSKELFRIDDIRPIVTDIYPAYYQFYNTYPLAMITIKNTAHYSIEVNVKSNISGYSERVHESGFKKIDKGETTDIPIFAIFGPKLLKASSRKPAIIDLIIEGRAGNTLEKRLSVSVMIHSRNSWNGEMDKLSFFVTADEEDILELSRQTIVSMDSVANRQLKVFMSAKTIFNMLQQKNIRYLSDPSIPYYQDDRVQFARETLEIRSGDCDDLVVLYSSLLESLGIGTAFVEVRDPEKDMAHLFLLFDSGLTEDQGSLISLNEKKYVVRTRQDGKRAVWIPVEVTLINYGFDKAWTAGAESYFKDAVLKAGMAEGWVKVMDVQ